MTTNPQGAVIQITKTPNNFLIISKRKKRSERPFRSEQTAYFYDYW